MATLTLKNNRGATITINRQGDIRINGDFTFTGTQLEALEQAGFSLEESVETHSDLADRLQKKHGLHKLYLSGKGNHLKVDNVVVHKHQQGSGVGTAVMHDLTKHADKHGLTMSLTPEAQKEHGSTSTSRLKDFYKRHGFVENKGKHKDYSISHSMIRHPKTIHEEVPTNNISTGNIASNNGGPTKKRVSKNASLVIKGMLRRRMVK
jgi:GNAT superfamily N-acetyltransferase